MLIGKVVGIKGGVQFSNNRIQVTDEITSFKEKAVLRWRLAPEIQWFLTATECFSSICRLQVKVDRGLESIQIIEGWESLYYMNKAPIPVFEITVSPECSKITTEIKIT